MMTISKQAVFLEWFCLIPAIDVDFFLHVLLVLIIVANHLL